MIERDRIRDIENERESVRQRSRERERERDIEEGRRKGEGGNLVGWREGQWKGRPDGGTGEG